MVFSYYKRLSRKQQAVYRASDQVGEIPLPNPYALRPLVDKIAAALKTQDRTQTETACQALVTAITQGLKVPPVRVQVLAVRPSNDWGELHGFYRTRAQGARGNISVWMRTARRRQVVAFRTFLRTLLHEVGPSPGFQPAASAGLLPHRGLLQARGQPFPATGPPGPTLRYSGKTSMIFRKFAGTERPIWAE